MNLKNARTINDKVRAFFKEGFKSNNKMYDDEHPAVDMAKAQKRLEDKALSYYAATTHIGSYATYAELGAMVSKMPAGQQAGNCTEMATLAAHYALLLNASPRKHCHIAVITHPGDHVFAVFTSTRADLPGEHEYASIKELGEAFLAHRNSVIVDPWLNTVCLASDYPAASYQKLGQWAGQGKRIGWAGPRGLLFYVPGGSDSDYLRAFQTAPVKIFDF